MRWKVLSSRTKTWSWGSWNPSVKTKNGIAFLAGSFLMINSLNIDISSKKRLCSTMELFSVVRVIFFNKYKIYKRYLPFSGRVWSFKLQYFKLLLKHPRWSFLLKVVKSFQRKTHLRNSIYDFFCIKFSKIKKISNVALPVNSCNAWITFVF